jgi:hypothetical protein
MVQAQQLMGRRMLLRQLQARLGSLLQETGV